MAYGHVFKNSTYTDGQKARFTLSKEDLKKHIVRGAQMLKIPFDRVSAGWWKEPYRVKPKGGHLPARVNALCQSARDMFKMGDQEVVGLTGITPKGAAPIAEELLYSPRNIAMTLWMASHYIADAHMPFHCDNRALASTTKQKTHGEVEDLWGKQVPELFHADTILHQPAEAILAAELPAKSHFAGLEFGEEIPPLKNHGDPWLESVYICRASFAASFALVPDTVAPVDGQKKVALKDILQDPDICGEERFREISRAIMTDAANSIAMFWQDAWCDFVGKASD